MSSNEIDFNNENLAKIGQHFQYPGLRIVVGVPYVGTDLFRPHTNAEQATMLAAIMELEVQWGTIFTPDNSLSNQQVLRVNRINPKIVLNEPIIPPDLSRRHGQDVATRRLKTFCNTVTTVAFLTVVKAQCSRPGTHPYDIFLEQVEHDVSGLKLAQSFFTQTHMEMMYRILSKSTSSDVMTLVREVISQGQGHIYPNLARDMINWHLQCKTPFEEYKTRDEILRLLGEGKRITHPTWGVGKNCIDVVYNAKDNEFLFHSYGDGGIPYKRIPAMYNTRFFQEFRLEAGYVVLPS